MAKGNKAGLLFVVIAILLVLAGIVYINLDQIKKIFKKAAPDSNGGGGTDPVTGNNGTAPTGGGNTQTGTGQGGVDWNRLLKNGVYNSSEVLMLQQALNKVNASLPVKKYSPQLVTDGDFGNNTQNALVAMTGLSQITLNQAFGYLKAGFQ